MKAQAREEKIRREVIRLSLVMLILLLSYVLYCFTFKFAVCPKILHFSITYTFLYRKNFIKTRTSKLMGS